MVRGREGWSRLSIHGLMLDIVTRCRRRTVMEDERRSGTNARVDSCRASTRTRAGGCWVSLTYDCFFGPAVFSHAR